jgi:N-acetylneuraminic acid mutarotase
LLLAVQGIAQQSLQVLHHHVRPAVSSGQAAKVGSLPSDQRLSLSIVLPLRNQNALTSLLAQIYDQASPNYRHFLSVGQFTEQFGPTAEDYQSVVDFAKANGLTVTGTAANRLVVPISGSVAQVENAFNVKMNDYQHPTEKRTFFSPDREPSLALSVPVAHIAGLNNYSIPRPMVTNAATAKGSVNPAVIGSGPGGSYLGSDMRAAYYGGAALIGSGQTVGLVEFDGYNISDVNETFGNAGQSYSVPIYNVLLDGATGSSVSGDDVEETLDIVQAISMAPGLSQVRVYIGIGSNDADILNAMASEDLAQQLSISWIWTPDDPSTDDVFFQEFAAQGQSVFAAAGDWGSYPSSTKPDYYPAEDAYVTAIGGTSLITNGAGGSWSSETAWVDSGGGISPDGIPIPSWQAGVANSSNEGSTTLRNVPDLAAEADFDNYACDMGTCQGTWAGTSFAAPRWAGFMALVNQQAVAAGIQTVGFINPAIYAIGEGSSYGSNLHDIMSGDNCAGGSPCYSAVPGYDLVTGWGSPNGQNLIDALAGSEVLGFTLVPSPGGLSINQGSFSTTTINVYDRGGFSGNVNLSISNLPSGVTATWGTNPTSGNSVLTLTASATASLGTASLTVTGSSGTLTATTLLSLTVNPPASFTLSANPSVLSIKQGVSGMTTVTVTDQYGFTGPVMLVASNLPSGVAATWGTNPTAGTSVLTLTASTTAAVGKATVTITGSSTGVPTAATTLSFAVIPFTLSDSPAGLIIAQGASGTSTVTVNHTSGFAGSVTLAATGLPSGVAATWGTNPTSGTSLLTLTASATASLGETTVTITGSSPGVPSATTTLALLVTADMTATNGWVWMGGGSTVPSSGGNPGVFGTLGMPAPQNIPGGRWMPSRWTDKAGNFWLFGGDGFDTNDTQGILGDLWEFNSSTNEWAWMGGSSTISNLSGNPGVYGTLGVLAAGNIPGGRDTGATWTDSKGYLWLFGGAGPDANGTSGILNDLWKFDPSINEWAWMGGSNTITGSGGNPGVYGTLGVPATENIPGSRYDALSWTDGQGNFWLFGGFGYGADDMSGWLNDLWEFNPSTSEWTWMGGSNTVGSGYGQPGVYGTLGVPTVGSVPGGRTTASNWTDSSGNFWLFGGLGFDISDTQGYLNDLWKFSPSTNIWTWMGGSNSVPPTSQNPNGNPGVYGTLGVAATGNIPGSRYEAYSWTDNSGNFWLFGGYGFDANDTWGGPNDLWEFNPSTNEWTWMDGSSTVPCSYCSIPGIYGALGVPAIGNIPGSRGSSASWTDSSGNLWLFGGSGYDANNTGGDLNDLWKYQFATPGFALSDSPSSLTITQGTSGTTTVALTNFGGFADNVTLVASGLPSGVTAAFGTNPTTGSSVFTLTASSTATVGSATVTVTGTSGTLTTTTTVALTVNPAPSFTLAASPASLTILQGASGTSAITVMGANGFTGSVTLAASGLPSGVTAAFSNNPTTGNSVLTLTASSTATVGTTTVTITGTSGPLNAATTFALTVDPAETVGTKSPIIPLVLTFDTSGTLGSITVLTQGATGLDFADAGSDTCTPNAAYTAGQTCTVNVTFTPKFAGIRNGAVVLYDTNGNVLAIGYLQGTGVGPQINFLPNTESTFPSNGLYPLGVAVDGSGNVYIADSLNNRILKENLSGGSYTQSTIQTSSLNTPYDVALDGSGNIYIADTNNYRVLKETPSAGGYSESIVADLSSSQIQPFGIAVDGSGNIYFSYILGTVYVETSSAGSYTQSTIQTNSSEIGYVAVDGSGSIYVADFANQQVLVETPSTGGYTQNTFPTSGLGAPWGVAVDGSGNVYISDLTNNVVLKETLSVGSYTQSTISTSALDAPYGIAVDGSGNVYIADTGNGRALKEDFADAPSLTFASTAVGSTSPDSPQTVTVENVGNAALTFPAASTGNNPSIEANFTFNSSGASACPLVSTGSSTAGMLAAGTSCQLPISFVPTVLGALSGSLVLTDNNLNAAAPGYVVQSIKLNGTGTQITPTITWTTPTAITYGTPLSRRQLNATSSVAGTFRYSPATGTVLTAGQQTLTATFTPTDTTDYTTATATVTLTVNQATPIIIWFTPKAIPYGTLLSATQLNASSTAAGNFTYSPAAGTVLNAGTQTLTATFTPTDATDYTTATASVTLTVNKAPLTISWATPAAISYGTALSATQLDASSTAAGTFAYTPAAGTVLAVGNHTLTVTLTPTNPTDYTTATATASVTLTVNKATPTITWATPAAITYGTALGATQLNASSSVAGSFTYSPVAGTVLTAGSHILSVTFAPTNTTDYTTATTSITLTVNMAAPTITWATPAAITFGTALSATQLNAKSSVPGAFVYSPIAGTIPAVGTDTLAVTFTPTDTTGYTTSTDSVLLKVNPAPSFTLGASPASLTVAQSASGKSTITVSGQNGFASSVTLVASGLPSGVTAAFATNPTTGTSVLTLTASNTAATGTTTVTIKGTSGSLTASTTIALTVSCTPTTITPYISINGGSTWTQESSATVNSPSTVVDLGPQPSTGGSWSWIGPNKYTSTLRQINGIPLTVGTDSYVATYTNPGGCKSTGTFTITVK